MMVAVIPRYDLEFSYNEWSAIEETPPQVGQLIDDLYDSEDNIVVTVDSRGDVVLIEVDGVTLGYNTTKALAEAYGLELVVPEYVGSYTLDAIRAVTEDNPIVTIIPLTENTEAYDAA